MNKYESLYIVNADQTEEAINAQVDKYAGIVTENGGVVAEVKHWGKRRLAYAIKFKNDGYYVLMNFEADPSFVKELERNYNIDENLMRYVVVRAEEVQAKAEKVEKVVKVEKVEEAE